MTAQHRKAEPDCAELLVAGRRLRPTEVFDTYWTFAAAVAQWVANYYEALPEHLQTTTSVATATVPEPTHEAADEPELDVDGQLERLRSYWPAFAPRLTRLHQGLLDLGYEPKVPEQRTAKRKASYISFFDPVDGRNLANTNSGTLYFMRKELADVLDGHEFVKSGREARVHFDTEEKVDFILEVAQRHKK